MRCSTVQATALQVARARAEHRVLLLVTQVVGDPETIAGSSALYRSTGSLRAAQRVRCAPYLAPIPPALHVPWSPFWRVHAAAPLHVQALRLCPAMAPVLCICGECCCCDNALTRLHNGHV